MGQPTWRQIKVIDVPDPQKTAWTLALDNVQPGNRIKIQADGTWTPKGQPAAIGPDGNFAPSGDGASSTLNGITFGALIGRIGISSAGPTTNPNPVTPPTPPATVVFDFTFPIGRVAILTVPDKVSGALFLGVNDLAANMSGVAGPLKVTLYEAL